MDKRDNRGRIIFQSLLPIILASGVLSAQGPVIVHTDLVTLRATVTDAKGNDVLGLDKSAFTVQDNDSPQKITAFSDEDMPVSSGDPPSLLDTRLVISRVTNR